MASISITAPSSAEEGERVSVSVRVTNTLDYHASFKAKISAVPDLYPDYVIGSIDQVILSGASVTRACPFTMPDCNTTIFVYVQRWSFDHWVYDNSASKVVSVEVPVETFHLSVHVPPWAAGGYIDPGSGDYPAYSTITLTAHPLSGYKFTSWGGDASGTSPTYNLYMNGDKYVEAYFEKVAVETFHLSVHVPPWAAGGYIDPGSGDYPAYSTITLTAYPLSGYKFTGWGGDASGTSLTYNLYMDDDKYVEAYFEKVAVDFAGSIAKKELDYDGAKEDIPVGASVPIDTEGRVHVWGQNDMATNQKLGIRFVVKDPDGEIVQDYQDWEISTTGPGDDHHFYGPKFGIDKPGDWTITIGLAMNPDSPVEVDSYAGVLCTVTEIVEGYVGTIIKKELEYDSVRGAIPVY